MRIQIKDLSCGYKNLKIVESISFDIKEGEIICLLGPNGVGKTTFFKTLLGFIKPLGGNVQFNGQDINKLTCKEFSQAIAYVPQANSLPFPFPVVDVVVSGRNAHTGITSTPKREDYEYALECIDGLGLSDMKDRIYTELSGGEQQMVLIARAMAQAPKLLIMDEPTSNLDFGNQVKIINNINLLKKKKLAIVMTTHSPDHVLLFGSKVVIFQNGKQAYFGDPKAVLTETLLGEIYGVEVDVCQVNTKRKKRIDVCVPNIII